TIFALSGAACCGRSHDFAGPTEARIQARAGSACTAQGADETAANEYHEREVSRGGYSLPRQVSAHVAGLREDDPVDGSNGPRRDYEPGRRVRTGLRSGDETGRAVQGSHSSLRPTEL